MNRISERQVHNMIQTLRELGVIDAVIIGNKEYWFVKDFREPYGEVGQGILGLAEVMPYT